MFHSTSEEAPAVSYGAGKGESRAGEIEDTEGGDDWTLNEGAEGGARQTKTKRRSRAFFYFLFLESVLFLVLHTGVI
jgi:hypothetical protein